ncbi:MAG: tryptophan synthase subunit alpha [Mariprofundaceae bacterium]|nr:tryptophan synthase subunit alpha [Mariprofundaceae bacterium]
MSRLSEVFMRCQSEKRTALIGYLTAGDPDISTSESLFLRLAEHVDVLEIGMPFSDPAADGSVIQAASERALAAGTHIADVFSLASSVREVYPDIGIVLMGYANTPFVLGFDVFSKQAAAAGVDAVLLVDMPPEEGYLCDDIFKRYGLDRILLLSPTSNEERIKLANKHASGFIYYVSLNGITGADMGEMAEIKHKVHAIRAHTDLPICVGFGVKTAEQASQVATFSDGVVVGSHFVGQITTHLKQRETMLSAISSAAHTMKTALQA